MTKSNVLFVIDGQNDFMDDPQIPGFSPALPVKGATKDMRRLCDFFLKNLSNFDRLYLTQDSHHILDISHPSWWKNTDGSSVSAFTPISYSDITSGKYVPTIKLHKSMEYVRQLEANGEFGHFIWPEHCIIGTIGHSFHKYVFEMISAFEKTGKWVNIITKGSNPFTEHFGAFRANVPNEDPSTQMDSNFLNSLLKYDNVFIAGEARSHCVANSLRQLLQEVPSLAPKLVVLEDCMSDVPGLPQGFYDEVQKIYDAAKAAGTQFIKSTNFTF